MLRTTMTGKSSRRRTSTSYPRVRSASGSPSWRGSTARSCDELVVEAWLTRAQKRVAKAWLAEQGLLEDE